MAVVPQRCLHRLKRKGKGRPAFRGRTGIQGTRGEVGKDGLRLCSLAPRPRLRAPVTGCLGAAKVAPGRPARLRQSAGAMVRVEGAAWLGGAFSGKVNVWCLAVGFAASPGAATLRGDGWAAD